MLTLFLSNYSLAQEAWFEQSFNEYHFSSVYFIDSTIGWIVGNSDTIFKTTDGGENWDGPSYNPITHTGHSIQFVNENLGWVVGSETSVLGTIHKSTNGGSSWFAQNNPILVEDHFLLSVNFLDENLGWAVGVYYHPLIGMNKLILKTTNGGSNWIQQIIDDSFSGLFSVFFINNDTGWVAGSGDTSSIYKTTDGGENWFSQQLTGPHWNVEFRTIQFIDNYNGWAAGWEYIMGSDGTILYKTTDSGNSWIKKELPSYFSSGVLNSIYFTDVNNGWAVGWGRHSGEEKGLIYRTINAGEDWIEQESNTTNVLYDLHMVDEKLGWVVGGNGTILKTTNGGVTFIEENKIDDLPINYRLSQNYPNPFNPVTTISYSLPVKSQVTLVVYNTLGESVKQLVNEEKEAGRYKVEFDATSLSSGIYFYRIQAGSFIQTKKMILMK